MQKIEKELAQLKGKQTDQDEKLNSDGRMHQLNNTVKQFKIEFDALFEQKKRGEADIMMIKNEIEDL